MTSLTIIAYHTRRAINWAILVLIAYIILRLSWGIFSTVWIAFFPPPVNPPNHAFGKLPALKFPKAAEDIKYSYRLETIEGYVPPASESAMVFFMPKNAASLTAIDAAQQFAGQLDFTEKPVQESKNAYIFVDPEEQLRQMRYDIISKTFLLKYLFEKDATLFTERDVPLPDAAIYEARAFLQSFLLYSDDLASGTTKTTFLKFVGNALLPATSHSQSDAIRIDFFRGDVAESRILTIGPNEGQISFLFSGSKNPKKRILEINDRYWPIEYGTFGTYGLKTSEQAWQELQSGLGYVAQAPTNNKRDVVIRKIYTAYYDSLESQTYLQPVFVFEGDNGFIGYIQAVAAPWTD